MLQQQMLFAQFPPSYNLPAGLPSSKAILVSVVSASFEQISCWQLCCSWRYVVFWLAAFASGFLYIFSHIMREISTAILLYSPGSSLLSIITGNSGKPEPLLKLEQCQWC